MIKTKPRIITHNCFRIKQNTKRLVERKLIKGLKTMERKLIKGLKTMLSFTIIKPAKKIFYMSIYLYEHIINKNLGKAGILMKKKVPSLYRLLKR